MISLSESLLLRFLLYSPLLL
jgi:hypothetical protein